MKKYFSVPSATLCACLSIVSFLFVAPARATTGSADEPAAPTGYLEPGTSREAQLRNDQRQAEPRDASAAGTLSAASVEANAATTPSILEEQIDSFSAYGGLSQQDSDTSGRVFSTWLDVRDGGQAVYYSYSPDEGQTWTPAVRLDRTSGAGTTTFVNIATDGFCNVYVLWIDTRHDVNGQIFSTVSRDCGVNWSTAKKISSTASMQDGSFSMAVRPNGIVFVAWGDDRNDPPGGALFTEVYSAVSLDYGQSWQPEKKISDIAPVTSDEYGPVAIFADNGDIIVSWLSNRAGGLGYDLYGARSGNIGVGFTADFRLNTEAAGTQTIWQYGLCAAHEHVYSVYESAVTLGGDPDVAVRSSHDNGATFGAKVTLGGTTYSTAGTQLSLDCAGDRALVAVNGGPTAAGTTDDVLVATSDDGGHSWGAFEKVDLGDTTGSGFEAYDIATTLTTRGDIVVAYTDQRIATSEGFFNYSPDGGTTWLSSDEEFTSFAGAHAVSLTRELGVLLSAPMDANGATGDATLHTWLTYFDTRPGAQGLYSSRLTFARSDETLDRLSGANRVETALAISQDSYPIGSTTTAIVIATSEAFPDGLAGGPLSVLVGGPLLITPSDSLDPAVSQEIVRLFDGQDDAGTDVYILGGGQAIAPGVEAAIAALNPMIDVERLEGTDRVGTAIAIANEMNEVRGLSPTEAILAYRGNFPDALAASAVAGSSAVNERLMPILLTDRAVLDPRVASWLTDNAASGLLTVNAVGGSAVLSDAVLAASGAIVANTTRYGGANRYDTAAILNRAMFSGPTAPTSIGVASGERFPDALTGGAHSGRLNRPLVLVSQNNIPSESMSYVTDNAATINGGSIYGGTAAISDLVKATMEALL